MSSDPNPGYFAWHRGLQTPYPVLCWLFHKPCFKHPVINQWVCIIIECPQVFVNETLNCGYAPVSYEHSRLEHPPFCWRCSFPVGKRWISIVMLLSPEGKIYLFSTTTRGQQRQRRCGLPSDFSTKKSQRSLQAIQASKNIKAPWWLDPKKDETKKTFKKTHLYCTYIYSHTYHNIYI